MEAVYKLEAHRDQQCDCQKNEGADGQAMFPRLVHITDDAERRVAEARHKHQQEGDRARGVRLFIQMRAWRVNARHVPVHRCA